MPIQIKSFRNKSNIKHLNGKDEIWLWLWVPAGLSEYSETVVVHGFSGKVYREQCENPSVSGSSVGRNPFLMREISGEWPDMSELAGKLLATQVTTINNQGEQKIIPECTVCQTLKGIGYKSRRPYLVPLLSQEKEYEATVGTYWSSDLPRLDS